jgi:DnaJ family protein A protein 2
MHTHLYEILNVQPNASEEELKKAWKKQAMKHHPDKGGDVEKFQEIQKAYEILSDSEKRKMYDRFGENGKPTLPDDIFSAWMNFKPRSQPKNIVYVHSIELEDLYNCKDQVFEWKRKVYCTGCDGIGGSKSSQSKCNTCGGTGVYVEIRRNGMFIQQLQSTCAGCSGKGIVFTSECEKCRGKCILVKNMKATFKIHPGNYHVILSHQGDQLTPGVQAGDIVVQLQAKHSQFQIQNHDILVKITISLYDAITGLKMTLPFFNGQSIEIQIDKPIKPGYIHTIPSKGMPKGNDNYGDMIITFDVQFPTKLLTIPSEFFI